MKISYRGLKLVNPLLKESICEHEVQNIHSACQDPECRLYFAYITKDANDYYYHIFSRNTAERATDIILTLDQPFELTYQVALKEQVTSKSKPNKDTYKCALSPPSDSYHNETVPMMRCRSIIGVFKVGPGQNLLDVLSRRDSECYTFDLALPLCFCSKKDIYILRLNNCKSNTSKRIGLCCCNCTKKGAQAMANRLAGKLRGIVAKLEDAPRIPLLHFPNLKL
ncbi:hypothetical protein Trydic_g20731 [Trypoxylus dichotomus]